jgi:hypothetical protein
MIADADGADLSLRSIAKSWVRRAKEHKETGGEGLGLRMGFVNLLITVGFVNAEATGHPTAVNTRTFYTEERLLPYVLENPEPRTLSGLLWKAVKMVWFANVG